MEATELTWADRILLQGREQGIEQGLEQGIEQGELNARRDIARRLLARKFQTVPADLDRRIAAADADLLDRIIDCVVTAPSVEDLLAGL